MYKFQFPVPLNETPLEEKVYNELFKMKHGCEGEVLTLHDWCAHKKVRQGACVPGRPQEGMAGVESFAIQGNQPSGHLDLSLRIYEQN